MNIWQENSPSCHYETELDYNIFIIFNNQRDINFIPFAFYIMY